MMRNLFTVAMLLITSSCSRTGHNSSLKFDESESFPYPNIVYPDMDLFGDKLSISMTVYSPPVFPSLSMFRQRANFIGFGTFDLASEKFDSLQLMEPVSQGLDKSSVQVLRPCFDREQNMYLPHWGFFATYSWKHMLRVAKFSSAGVLVWNKDVTDNRGLTADNIYGDVSGCSAFDDDQIAVYVSDFGFVLKPNGVFDSVGRSSLGINSLRNGSYYRTRGSKEQISDFKGSILSPEGQRKNDVYAPRDLSIYHSMVLTSGNLFLSGHSNIPSGGFYPFSAAIREIWSSDGKTAIVSKDSCRDPEGCKLAGEDGAGMAVINGLEIENGLLSVQIGKMDVGFRPWDRPVPEAVQLLDQNLDNLAKFDTSRLKEVAGFELVTNSFLVSADIIYAIGYGLHMEPKLAKIYREGTELKLAWTKLLCGNRCINLIGDRDWFSSGQTADIIP